MSNKRKTSKHKSQDTTLYLETLLKQCSPDLLPVLISEPWVASDGRVVYETDGLSFGFMPTEFDIDGDIVKGQTWASENVGLERAYELSVMRVMARVVQEAEQLLLEEIRVIYGLYSMHKGTRYEDVFVFLMTEIWDRHPALSTWLNALTLEENGEVA